MERYYTNPGTPVKINKIPKIDKDGTITLIDGEKTNFQEYIESFRDETDIEQIIYRFINGDPSALSKAQGFYGDMKGMPKDYAEVLNLVYDGQRVFENMPVDVKEKFGNDFNQWFAQMGTDSWIEKMSINKSDADIKPEEGAKE